MVDESIKEVLNNKHGELNFKGLLAFMEATGIEFRERALRWPVGIATFYCVYIDLERLSKFNDKMTFFVILHEIAHYKRIARFGKEHIINMLSLEDFEEFCEHVITEEIVADRYACQLYQRFNQQAFPRLATQQLHLEEKQKEYKKTAEQLFGVIQHSEENYIKLLESFLE